MRLLGLDPGLRHTGWGIIEAEGNSLRHLANGAVASDASLDLAGRLVQLFEGIEKVIADWQPQEAAVEETFVNKNPVSTLKLGQARGIALLVPALHNLAVEEYAPNKIKKSVVGAGHAGKEQIHAMVSMLLPGCKIANEHAADALAVAICHAHYAGSRRHLGKAITMAGGKV
ncbi:crossover junction endodeoxyribonuclease RuvC [Sneathiella aquimaris]|uniref:crossover junction endodeoxyribonuclease RuvC n=1 Tax=Sneathiella aquimaris TaxID=2599305 RepID=UPI00146F1DD0|nr:crossover junction endodeoxyribonuclease RuvC [Sneathiella aquimaris]